MDLEPGSEFLSVIILGPDGKEILIEVQKRCPGMNFCHSPNLPYVEQMIVDAASDRLIIRAVEWDADSPIREDHFWWTYRLSTGEKIGRYNPRERMADANPVWWLVEAKPVNSTSLILLHWYTRSLDWDVGDGGARFTLVDDTARPLWSLDAKSDYGTIGLGQYLDSSLFQSNPAILPEARPNHFAIRLFTAKERVTFRLSSLADGRCQAVEIAREPFKNE